MLGNTFGSRVNRDGDSVKRREGKIVILTG